MSDTRAEVADLYRGLVMARSAEDRLRMAVRSFDAARDLVLASLPAGLSELEIRRQLFGRFYPELSGSEIPPALRG